MKYRYKLMAGIIILLCISFSVGGILIIQNSFNYSYNEETAKWSNDFATILNTIKIAGKSSSKNCIETIKNVVNEIDGMGNNGYCYLKLEQSGEKETIFEAGDSKYYDNNDKRYFEISGNVLVNLSENEKQVVTITAVYDLSDVYDFRNGQVSLFRKMIIVFIGCGLFIAFFFAMWITRPVEQLSKMVREIAKGKYEKRTNIKSGDEVEELAKDINLMAGKIEEDINELQENAKKQDQFMGSFAHEMKTPMTSIIGYADLIRSQTMDADETAQAANYIFSEGKRLEALSLKMLELMVVNNEEIVLTKNNPREVIMDVSRMLKFYLKEHGVTLKVNCQNGLVMMDKDLFKSLISNLCDNAVKAIDQKGVIYIGGKIIDGNYVVQIKDNGRGMSKEELEKITQAFYRVDKSRSRAQGGAGLGLAICKKIVEIHHAKMKYKSEPSKGTIVQIILKAVAE